MSSNRTVVVINNICAIFCFLLEATRDFFSMKYKLVTVLEEKICGLEDQFRYHRASERLRDSWMTRFRKLRHSRFKKTKELSAKEPESMDTRKEV